MRLIAGRALAMGGVTDVTIFDRAENRILPVYYHEGRYYVAGKPGNEYQVNIRNNQSGEILSVISVDGVNAVSGETANWSQTGYVLSPYTSFGIKGWRKSLQRVAAFFFTELENSYAARTGRPDNVGVIGVAVFRKKSEPAVGVLRDFAAQRRAGCRAERGRKTGKRRQESSQLAELIRLRHGHRRWSGSRRKRAWVPDMARARPRWCAIPISSEHRRTRTKWSRFTTTATATWWRGA